MRVHLSILKYECYPYSFIHFIKFVFNVGHRLANKAHQRVFTRNVKPYEHADFIFQYSQLVLTAVAIWVCPARPGGRESPIGSCVNQHCVTRIPFDL